MGTVDNAVAALLHALAPASCHWCRAQGAVLGICAPCSASLPWNDFACRDRTWAAFRYAPPIDQAIRELKFHGRLAPAHLLGGLMARRLARRAEPLPELLIPVPLSVGRLRRRGYNQALELGRGLARTLALPLAPSAARRTRETAEQTRLDAAARRLNVRDAFAVDAAAVRGRHVVLLDDVVTTGATLAELARAVRAAGASRIEAWAAARAL
jgi:ComF family protein